MSGIEPRRAVSISTFGPSALATPANALTVLRLIASPVLMVLVVTTGPATWLLVSLWFVFSCTDGIDGFVARRMGATRSGAFLDPLADKFLVLGVLVALAAIGEVSWLPVTLIGCREVAMSVFRSYAGRRGVSIPARKSAKVKTLLQDCVIGLALIPPVGLHHVFVVRDGLWIAVALTLYTGYEYARDGRRVLAHGPNAAPAPQAVQSSAS
jgi:CDP-diacylglycerol--glycerol-3-phosphate 3-phosphatidyltransferase